MSDDRTPARPWYDAVVDLGDSHTTGPYAYALAKFTYHISGGQCHPIAPDPLLHDFRDPELSPRLRPGTDFWPRKQATDFVVRGSAFAPGGQPVPALTVALQVGEFAKHVYVFGRRSITWHPSGRLAIGDPEPFTEIPLTYDNAYGGVDFRVEDPDLRPFDLRVMLDCDHPGLYPRNPFGKGYLVAPGEVPEMEMPNLEDPNDRLTPERIITETPIAWYRQPLPWCFDWVHPVMFPRALYAGPGADPWYPGPEDEQMPEVHRGFLLSGYRTQMAAHDADHGPDSRFFQGASHGLIFSQSVLGWPVVIQGMHPMYDLQFVLPPAPPAFEFEIDGARTPIAPRLHSVVCEPAEEKVTMVWAANLALPRKVIPGIHKYIYVAARINNDEPIWYEAPPTLHDQLAAAEERNET